MENQQPVVSIIIPIYNVGFTSVVDMGKTIQGRRRLRIIPVLKF